ncbi:MAG: hypothetical protein A2Z07_08110 [Armatimonadetes bacterium RBG_16_67_12]|nr:MAG: hypothetical protein A2Z07_08110 [Armatimonadetes bacterium RBG_16_67_12]
MRAASHVSHLVILAPAALHREAWRALLSGQPDIRIAGAIADPSEAAGMLQPGRPTTVLIDLPSPDPDVVRRLRSAASDCGLLFFVPSYDLAEIIPLLQAGATGCVSRDDSVGDLARAVIAAGRGEIVLPPAIATRALAALARGEQLGTSPTAAGAEGLIEPLSEREAEVLRALAQGLTNKDIAQTLILSVRTVEAHLRGIYGKLDVHSRTEAALWAVKHGYSPQE